MICWIGILLPKIAMIVGKAASVLIIRPPSDTGLGKPVYRQRLEVVVAVLRMHARPWCRPPRPALKAHAPQQQARRVGMVRADMNVLAGLLVGFLVIEDPAVTLRVKRDEGRIEEGPARGKHDFIQARDELLEADESLDQRDDL